MRRKNKETEESGRMIVGRGEKIHNYLYFKDSITEDGNQFI